VLSCDAVGLAEPDGFGDVAAALVGTEVVAELDKKLDAVLDGAPGARAPTSWVTVESSRFTIRSVIR
jgi:hypothetical protein